jgi:hypothetical protein
MAEDRLTFAAMVLVAIVAIIGIFSLSGQIGMSKITGAADQTGVVEVTLAGAVDIDLTDANVSFGSGYPTGASSQMDTDGNQGTWVNTTFFPHNDDASTATGEGMILENNGTVYANVTIKAAQIVDTFLGGGVMEFKADEDNAGEADTCLQGTRQSTFENLTTAEKVLCTKMDYAPTKDELEIEYRLLVLNNATTGLHNNTITFTASDATT